MCVSVHRPRSCPISPSHRLRSFCFLLGLTLALFLWSPAFDVSAQSLGYAVGTMQRKLLELTGWIRNFLFVCAGGAFLGLLASWFTGRPNIKWLITLAVSLVLLALVGAITTFFVDVEANRAPGGDPRGTLGDALGE